MGLNRRSLVAYSLVGLRHQLGSLGLVALLVRYTATGFGEELAFRGYIWQRTQEAGLVWPFMVVVNAAAFTAAHMPSVLEGLWIHSSRLLAVTPWGLIGIFVIGIVFSLIRLVSRNVTLPALFHTANDISGDLVAEAVFVVVLALALTWRSTSRLLGRRATLLRPRGTR